MKKPSIEITQITFSGGQVIDLKPAEKIVIVGPNNSGKSQTIKEISQYLAKPDDPRTVVVKEVILNKVGQAGDLKQFLEDFGEIFNTTYLYESAKIHTGHVAYLDSVGLHSGVAPLFLKTINANDRLSICDLQKSVASNQQKSKPQHVLYDRSKLMDEISALFKQAFGKHLMFDFRGGSELPIHVGEKPPSELVDRVSDEYVAAVRKNPLLHEQGDGMKSYAGILFEAIVSKYDVTLLDEPEAFLHPPQMRRLGHTLAAEVKGQLFVATHSSDVLRGFLEGTKGNVRILRIQRDGDINIVTEAAPEVIKELWERPSLKYSNALEGIFHEQTILCEDDSDCRLFNAMADHLSEGNEGAWKDTAFVPTGGKHGIPKIAKVLRQIGVPVKAIFDIDVLADQTTLKDVVEAFGGSWDKVSTIWRRVDSAIRGGERPLTTVEIKTEIKRLIDRAAQDDLPKGDIQAVLKQDKPWARVKQMGTAAVPKGDAHKDFAKLTATLEEIGVFTIPVGEVENFFPQIGGHGPKFVTKLLSEVELSDPGLLNLREFVARVHHGAAGSI